MADLNTSINFETNAEVVRRQIQKLSHEADSLANKNRLSRALEGNKASAKFLTGEMSAKKAIIKLDKQINSLAIQRMKTATAGYDFGAQSKYIKGLMVQNETLRIQRKILDDNATAMVNLGKNTQWAGRQLVVGFTVPLSIAAGAAMKSFSELEKEMLRFKRVYGDAFTSTEELDKMANEVKNLATEWTKYGVAVSETAKIAADAAGAGFTGKQLTSQIDAANKVAVLGELDRQKAMKATIALQSTFKMSNDELAQTINYLNQLENQTIVTLDDMVTAIPKAATVVQGLGGSVKDLGTFLAAMEEGGVTAAEAANALKSGLGSLLNPSKKAREELSSIGISMESLWATSEQNGQGVMYVVQELATAFERLGQTQKQALTEEIFGKHQFARMNALLQNINKGTQASQAKGVAGTSQLESALIAQQELGKLGSSSFTKFQSSIEKLKAAAAPLGETIMNIVTPLIEFAGKMLDKFNSMPDLFKNISVGIVGAAGVMAPLFLMLLGQIQNLIGNGMKFVNMIKFAGKNINWVAEENLTLVDMLQKVDYQLIAENKLLQENTVLWRGRNAASMGSTAPVGKGRKKFASGGGVPGTGNRDTVPAMLTPGEFIVNKAASEKFGGLLRAINSGRVQGLVNGRIHVKEGQAQAHLTSSIQGIPDVSGLSNSGTHKLNIFKMVANELGLDPEGFISYVSNLTRPLPKRINSALTGRGVSGNELKRYFGARQVKIGNQPMAQALWSAGVNRERIISGEFVPAQKEFDRLLKQKISRRGNNLINDPILYRMVADVLDKMIASGKHQEFAGHMKMAGSQLGQIRPGRIKELEAALLKYNATAAPEDRIAPSHLLMRVRSEGYGPQPIVGAGSSYRNYGSANWNGMVGPTRNPALGEGLFFANTGGIVPGTGNKDTVPAMLTPGESVINKKASAKFGPLLEAINSGKIKMLSKGDVAGKRDRGYRGGLSSEQRRGLLDPLRENLERYLGEIAHMLGQSAAEMAETRHFLEGDLERQTRAAHVVPVRDELGQKVYDDKALVGSTFSENQAMFDLSGKEAQAIYRQINAAEEDAEVQEKRTVILDKLKNQEHIVLKEERKMLQEMMAETNELRKSDPELYGRLPENLRGSKGAAVMAGLSDESRLFATGKGITSDEYNTAVAMGTGPSSGKKKKSSGDDFEKIDKSSSSFDGGMGLMMATQAIAMTGVTDKLGAFGDAILTATTALGGLSMLGIDPMGGLKGKLGKAGKFSKLSGLFGKVKGRIGPGLGIGLAGSILGGVIGDGQGGTRDVVGKATSYAGIGAGVGALFGPLGAGIGAAAGALTGFVVQVNANKKAMKELTTSIQGSSVAASKMAKEIQEKFQLGTGKSFADLLSAGGSLNKEDKEFYKQFAESMTEDSAFTKRINELVEAQKKGVLGPDQIVRELQALTLELRGSGVDEKSISIILAAFVDKLPEAVRQGLDPKTLAASANQTTQQIIDSLGSGTAMQDASSVSSLMMSLNQSLLSLDPTAKDFDTKLAELTDQLRQTRDAHEEMVSGMIKYSSEYSEYINGLAANAEALIKSGQGQGLKEGQPTQLLRNLDSDLSAETAASIEMLMEAGINLDFAAEALKDASSASSYAQIADSINAMANAAFAAGQYKIAEAGRIAENKALTDSISALDKATSKFDKEMSEGKKAYSAGGTTFTKFGINNQEVEAAEIDAELEVKRISIEMGKVKEFAAKFNSMFNANIDSFADASFIIDNIGRQIESIQRDKIQPLQDRIDGLNRKNELDSRKIDKLQEKQQKWEEAKQKRIEKINEKYDKQNKAIDDQAKALEKVRQQNEYIAQQQRANISLADSLSKGDLAGAAGAMVQSAQNQAQYAATLSEQDLATRRDAMEARRAAELKKVEDTKNPYDEKIEAIEDRIKNRTYAIQAAEDKIYQIQKDQIQPLERKQALMQSILATAQAEAEQAMHNADSMDKELRARQAALLEAQKSVIAAREEKTLQEEIEDSYKKQIDGIAKKHGLETKNAEELRKQLSDNAVEAQKDAELFLEKYNDAVKAMDEISKGSATAIEEWTSSEVQPDSVLDIINKAIKTINGEDLDEGPKHQERQERQQRAAGGSIEGTGGMDSVRALLTPGEFVMRRSAVKRIGLDKLRRMNQGDPTVDPDFYTGGAEKFATGGYVKPNFLGTFGDTAALAIAKREPFKSNQSVQNAINGINTSSDGTIKLSASRGNAAVAEAFENLIGATEIMGESVYQRCAANIGKIWRKYVGTPIVAGSPSAHAAGSKLKNLGYMQSGYNAPRGSIYFWDSSIGGGSGHVAVADGKGYAINNWGGNRIEKNPVRNMAPGAYRGYSIRYNTGGLVPGTSNYDSVMGALTPGEFVVNRNAVNAIGTGPLRALNEGRVRSKAPVPSIQYSESSGGAVEYNTYDLSFTINDASDPYEVANVVVRQLERANKSKMRKR